MSYTRNYREIMQPEARIGRNTIKPRNIYRISTYTGSKPITKTGDDSRWIFVIGIVDEKVHCIRLNDIKPLEFTNFIGKIRDKRIPIKRDQLLSLLLKKFNKNGKDLFEQHIKNDTSVYKIGHSTYRIYKLEKIRYIWEIRFEEDMLQEIFKEGTTATTRRKLLTEEIQERDG